MLISAVCIAGMYSRPGPANTPVASDDEYVVLVNTGEAPIDLTRWSLTTRKRDGLDHFRYLFPRFLSNGDLWLLDPGGLVFIHTGRGSNGRTSTCGEANQIHLYQHRPACIWDEAEDSACLYNRAGNFVASSVLPVTRNS